MNFELEREVKLKINLTEEELQTKYGENLKSELEGKLYDVLSTLFNNLVGIKKIIVPGEFKSNKGTKAISCNVKAAEGYLFKLKDDQPVTFLSIDRDEHKILVEYFKTANVKMKTVDNEGNKSELTQGAKKD